MYEYVKALHIIFVVAWFSGMFYMPRLFIYNTEAQDKPAEHKFIFHQQFNIMMKRLWFGITWPAAIITLVFGILLVFSGHWNTMMGQQAGRWLLVKIIFVCFLYLYHITLHIIFRQQLKGIFRYTSQQLRMWNEVATVFLVAIVMLAVVKQSISFVWGLLGLFIFVILLLLAIKLYKTIRNVKNK